MKNTQAQYINAMHPDHTEVGRRTGCVRHRSPKPTNPLLPAQHCFISPHIAWATRAARERLLAVSVGNVRAFLNGQPQNVLKEDGHND
jgi:phosphoglycerate dehydrogenase-like enzyme